MSFGQHFVYEKQARVLPDGDYDVTLAEPFETSVGGFAVLRFPFTVDGINEVVVPNYFDLFDCTDPYDQTKLQMFNRKASRIKECFLLPGDFADGNYRTWRGCHGRIRIEKSESGFMNVTQFYRNADMKNIDDIPSF